jgi:hypothetical protein
MFIDTLEQFFLGNEELFRGLFIHSLGYNFEPYPVIRLDMNLNRSTPKALRESILFKLNHIANNEGLSLDAPNPGSALEGLVKSLWKKYGEREVVVLIDDYDKPILDHINKPELAMKIRDTLCNFYVILKKLENYLHFVFITGISKFGKRALGSKLNDFNDISNLSSYAGICGFTETEFINNFHHLFDNLLSSLVNSGKLKKGDDHKVLINSILKKYKGYSWDGETQVLNPFSINNCFSDNMLDDYWWKTGPPLFLKNAISQDPTAYLQPEWGKVLADDVDGAKISNFRSVDLLFQTGYLTIDNVIINKEDIFEHNRYIDFKHKTYYSLKIPNNEVLGYFTRALFKNLFPLLSDERKKLSCRDGITNSIKAKNATELTEILRKHLANLPYNQNADRTFLWQYEPKLAEFFFHAFFLSFFDGLGLRVIPKPMSSLGRTDIDITLPNDVHAVLDIKYIPNKNNKKELPIDIDITMDKKVNEAIAQAYSSLQYKKYKYQANKVIMTGIVIYARDFVLVKFAE